MKRTVLGIMLFFVIFPILFGCAFARTTAEGLGEITFEVYDSEGVMVESELVTYHDGDTLLGLLQDTFTVYCQDQSGQPSESCDYVGLYGVYVMGIEDVQAFVGNTYIAFYINDEYAVTGIDATEIIDGNVYQFKYETY